MKVARISVKEYKAKAKIPTEHEEQVEVIDWARANSWRYPELKRLFAIPNGAKFGREKRIIRGRAVPLAVLQMAKLKREGFQVGVPDLQLPKARGGWHGLFIEMKRQKGGEESPDQKEWREYLNSEGYLSVLCFSGEEAIAELEAYLSFPETETVDQIEKAA